MCQQTDPRAVWRVLPRSVGPGAAASETISLEPVDAVEITILCDNVTDVLLMDEGPAKRPAPVGAGLPRIAADVLQEGESPDAFEAEHGFSALVTIRKGEETHRFLFDAGLSPDGMVGNMRRLGAALRADHRADLRRARGGLPGRGRPGPLHGVEGDPPDRGAVPGSLRPEQRRDALRAGGLTQGVGARDASRASSSRSTQ